MIHKSVSYDSQVREMLRIKNRQKMPCKKPKYKQALMTDLRLNILMTVWG